ncbi:MAG: SGNH/GDSL hydrolase family protein, partial [Planctomycetes bacterium]|nr:SGNH/GDSL hydrolase family protein [Planctomycetota bacterium]
MRRFVVVLAVVLLCVASVGWTQAAEFPIKPNDVVVMAGDSITAQHLHSNYIEGYCLARFPKWNLRFRNSGVGGDTVPKVLARLDWDVLAWKPMVVTIELGMNDSGGGLPGVEGYLKGMETLIQRIKAAGARPMFLTASPVNDGTTADKLAGRNLTLDKMATEIKALAAKNGLPCADQFHAVLDMWGKNKKNPNGINLVGDPVHPGAPGQLTMAHACLVGLGAPALVSKATIDASGKATEQVKCTVTNVKAEGDKLSFERLDEALPMPIP